MRHVHAALRQVDGVRDVEVLLREGKAIVTHDKASLVALQAALQDAGYEASVLAG